jgi:inhibitor of KinA sporulation pathway (predicted exonuclease)
MTDHPNKHDHTLSSPPDYYLVIDFEATCCDRGSVPRQQMEIIEIGAVMVEATYLNPVDEFQSFVRPLRHPQLTPFCTALTSITQADVDAAPTFAQVVAVFRPWLYRYANFVFCSWGDYDLHQLQQDCAYHRVPNPIGAPHLNVKKLFTESQQMKKKPGLGEAVRAAGLTFAGTHHRGIDDARNIARLLPHALGMARLEQGPREARRPRRR